MKTDLFRSYIDIKPTIYVLCKADTFKNFTLGKKYMATATQRMNDGSYTNYIVGDEDKGIVLLTIERLIDTFTICSN